MGLTPNGNTTTPPVNALDPSFSVVYYINIYKSSNNNLNYTVLQYNSVTSLYDVVDDFTIDTTIVKNNKSKTSDDDYIVMPLQIKLTDPDDDNKVIYKTYYLRMYNQQ